MDKYLYIPINNGDISWNLNISPVLPEDDGLHTCRVKADNDISQAGYLEVMGEYPYNPSNNGDISWNLNISPFLTEVTLTVTVIIGIYAAKIK